MEFKKLNKNVPILGMQHQSKNIVVGTVYVMHTLCICWTYVGFNHPQGQSRVVGQTCGAQLDCYIPVNMTWYPYICLITWNSHTHHPLYPTKLPIDLANDVVEAIRQVEVLNLTIYMPHICMTYANKANHCCIDWFILSPQYNILCKKYGAQTLCIVHSSLNIEDQITALIWKERILQFPEGRGYAGEYQLDTHKAYAKPKCSRCST